MDKYCEESILNERRNRIKLIIDVDKDYYELIKYNVEHGQNYKYFEIIANGIPYEARPQGEYSRGFIDALDKAFSKFDANCTYSGDRVLQKLEKLKAEKGGAE